MSIGPWQIFLVLLIVLLLFGAGKIPRLMGDMAKGVKAFKKGMKDDGEDDDETKPKELDSESADKALKEKDQDKDKDASAKS